MEDPKSLSVVTLTVEQKKKIEEVAYRIQLLNSTNIVLRQVIDEATLHDVWKL